MDGTKIGDRLIELRGNKTQTEVSEALGISNTTLSMYENGERIPRDEIKVRIANFYGLTVGEIFFVD
ncbi:MAG: helix-turn-helix transcriptional regulator [Clostridia bacterium]|nr:helix-turn-helix transcriptional regulator [Clostridia bacterium]